MATAIMKQKEVPEMDDVEEIISKISVFLTLFMTMWV